MEPWSDENRERLIAVDRRHLWRPYTAADEHERRDPFVVVRAEGPWLFDADGRRYLDTNGSWWCNTLGHGRAELRRALCEQAERMLHVTLAGVVHEPAARLAERLAVWAPGSLNRVFFTDNGSSAVEVALKIALQFFRQNGEPARHRFLALPGAYHGDTLGVMSLGGVGAFVETFRPVLFDAWRPPEPPRDEGGWDWEPVAVAFERELAERGEDVAAVVLEPIVQGAAGMRVHPPWLLARIAEAARAAGALLVLDEVFTGFGRTGRWLACEWAGVEPDLLCLAKGLTGGTMPLAATLASERLFDGFRGGRSRALMHGHTYCGHPLGSAVALEALRIYEEERILEHVAALAPRLCEGFEAMARDLPGVQRPRSIGMVAAVDLGEGGYHGATGWRVHEAARRRGLYLRPLGDTVYVCPPLVIQEEELDFLLEGVREAVAEALT